MKIEVIGYDPTKGNIPSAKILLEGEDKKEVFHAVDLIVRDWTSRGIGKIELNVKEVK